MCKKYPAAEIKVLAGPLSSVLCSFQLLVAAADPWLVLCPSSPCAGILRSLSLLCVQSPPLCVWSHSASLFCGCL